jgi:hypothetical protein
MRKIYFGNFRIYVIEHIKAIEAQNPGHQSTEWFLLRYLGKIAKNSNPPTTPGRVEGSMRGLIRFYVDTIDENSELGDRCIKIYAEYRKTLRFNQES